MKKIDPKYFINEKGVNYLPSINEILDKDEQILWKGKPKRSSYILNSCFKLFPFALIWLIFDIGFIIMMANIIENIEWWLILIFVIFFIFHLIPVWVWISSIITSFRRLKIEEYAFTNKRIIIKKGLIAADIKSINYESLTSVNIRIGIIERMCKVGDIYIVSKNEKYVIEDISDPYFIYQKLSKIANDIKSDIIYPNAYRPNENPGFKTSYKNKDNIK